MQSKFTITFEVEPGTEPVHASETIAKELNFWSLYLKDFGFPDPEIGWDVSVRVLNDDSRKSHQEENDFKYLPIMIRFTDQFSEYLFDSVEGHPGYASLFNDEEPGLVEIEPSEENPTMPT